MLSPCARGEERPEYVVHGATLELSTPRTTIQAPSEYWKWSKASESPKGFRTYRCSSVIDPRNFYILLVTTQPTPPLGGADMDEIMAGIRKPLPANLVIAAPRTDPSDVPWPGSYRLHYELGSASGSVYVHAYTAHRGHVFVTLYVSLNPTELPEFVAFTRSLSVTERKGVPKGLVAGLIGAVAIIGIIQWMRSRSAANRD